jgi:hypothetical protein
MTGESSQRVVSPSAEDVLRDLASYVGAGGHNAETVNPATFYDKIKWGIDHLTGALETDAQRYRKLRSIGAAPGGSMHLEDGLVMVATNLDNWLDDFLAPTIKPSPSHAVEYGKRYCALYGEAGDASQVAAAPELYEALSDLLENPAYQTAIGGNPNAVDEMVNRAFAALRKARGERE